MIAEYRVQHPEAELAPLCAALGVSRSWFYARPSSLQITQQAVALRGRIEEIVLEMPGYGYRPVTKQLQKEGWCVNHKRVLRIMRQESLLCRLRKRFVHTTHSQHAYRTYPNLLKEVVLTRTDQVWQADITYIRLPGSFCYLAVLLDAFSRFCVTWQLSRDLATVP